MDGADTVGGTQPQVSTGAAPARSAWRQWLDQPQRVWLRRALFQIHLWVGIAFGLYVFVVSVTGSAIVFRNELYGYFGQRPVVTPAGEKLAPEELAKKALEAHPGFAIAYTFPGRKPTDVTEYWMNKGDEQIQRVFNPYTGQDLGRSVSIWISVVKWMGDLHTDLLMPSTGRGGNGRFWNGIGSVLLTLLSLTGLILWWPGVRSWKRNLGIKFRSGWKRINWDLHSAVGFWTFLLVFMWGFTGIYLVWPTPFQEWLNKYTPLELYKPLAELDAPTPAGGESSRFVLAQPAPSKGDSGGPDVSKGGGGGMTQGGGQGAGQGDAPRPRRRRQPPRGTKGDQFLRWFYYLHFGNFAGPWTKGLWVALGLIPPMLFVTGTIMWWNRVVRRWLTRTRTS